MASANFDQITLNDYKWLNEPKKWSLDNEVLEVTTEKGTDFWKETRYNYYHNSGHLYGVQLEENFTFTACIEADCHTQHDQAGVMIYLNEKHYLKAGLQYFEGRLMIGSVYTDVNSDWAAGVYTGNPRKFWLRLSRVYGEVVVRYSTDNKEWIRLRVASVPKEHKYLVGPMCCSPLRAGLGVKFSDFSITVPPREILNFTYE